MSEGAVGFDLFACLEEECVIAPGERKCIPTGIAIEVPPGWEAQIRPRSGLALSHGITVLNAPGTIDNDFRGEIQVLLVNLGDAPFRARHGDRIAQLIFAPFFTPKLEFVKSLSPSHRQGKGFGSTGI
ncbi:MAG: dUTP diphosphatase [Deltaproteobacteria bacterium]|nr:dUTP diphosphatase [Deltaproteobacteria bacterium]